MVEVSESVPLLEADRQEGEALVSEMEGMASLEKNTA